MASVNTDVDTKKDIVEQKDVVLEQHNISDSEKVYKRKTNLLSTSIIKLNIGGHKYSTTLSTLTKFNSIFKIIFEHKWKTTIDDEGAMFFDRDGEIFSYILQFFRSGKIIFIEEHNQKIIEEQILEEADFFQITSLKDYICGIPNRELDELPKYRNYDTFLPIEWLQMKLDEDNYRNNPACESLLLINVFSNISKFIYINKIPGDIEIILDYAHREEYIKLKDGICINKKKDFQKEFDIMTCHMFKEFDEELWNNMVIAGGSITTVIKKKPKQMKHIKNTLDLELYYHGPEILNIGYTGYHRYRSNIIHSTYNPYGKPMNFYTGDIDIFLYGLDVDSANKKVEDIIKRLQLTMNIQFLVIKNENAINIVYGFPKRTIQIVLRIYKNIREILSGFDLDSCTFAYDGNNVWTIPRGHRAICYQLNIMDPGRQSTTYEFRSIKYASRGFAIGIPGLRRHKINPHIYFKKSSRLCGLAKLLNMAVKFQSKKLYNEYNNSNRYTRQLYKYQLHKIINRYEIVEKELKEKRYISDYNSTFIPYGPFWRISIIWNMFEKNKDGYLKGNQYGTNITNEPLKYTYYRITTNEELQENIPNIISHKWKIRDPGTQLTGSFQPTYDDWYESVYE